MLRYFVFRGPKFHEKCGEIILRNGFRRRFQSNFAKPLRKMRPHRLTPGEFPPNHCAKFRCETSLRSRISFSAPNYRESFFASRPPPKYRKTFREILAEGNPQALHLNDQTLLIISGVFLARFLVFVWYEDNTDSVWYVDNTDSALLSDCRNCRTPVGTVGLSDVASDSV